MSFYHIQLIVDARPARLISGKVTLRRSGEARISKRKCMHANKIVPIITAVTY
jgi:hypothetical protein